MSRVFLVALLLPGVLAADQGVSPIQKVVDMLDELQREVITEGTKEAQTYNKFACFCKDVSHEKTLDIGEGQDDVDRLTALIGKLAAARNDLDSDISDLNAKVEELSKGIQAT